MNHSLVTDHPTGRQDRILQQLSDLRRVCTLQAPLSHCSIRLLSVMLSYMEPAFTQKTYLSHLVHCQSVLVVANAALVWWFFQIKTICCVRPQQVLPFPFVGSFNSCGLDTRLKGPMAFSVASKRQANGEQNCPNGCRQTQIQVILITSPTL